MYRNAIFYLTPADVEETLQQFHMHSESSPMCKTCARPCDQLFPKTSQKRAASIQTLQIHRNRVSRGCSPVLLFAWPVVPTLNSPALYCPDQACLQKRGCGWLLCKHKSPWEIKVSLTRCASLPSWAHGWCGAITQRRPGTLNGPLSVYRNSPATCTISHFYVNFVRVLRLFLQPACEGPFFHGAQGGGAARPVDTRPNIPCAGGGGRTEPLRETWQGQTPPLSTLQNNWKRSSAVVWRMFGAHVVLVLRAMVVVIPAAAFIT